MNDNQLQRVWMILAVGLSVPAFFLNLGTHPYIEDESIRALVALEMDLSGNYVFPTLGGVPYLAKPPLYNWILLLFSKIAGGLNEWTTRIPTVLFLYGYVYYTFKVQRRLGFNKLHAVLVALMFLTCGRILFWDSFLGLIDVLFSWVCYGLIMEMYFSWNKQKWRRYFRLSYFLLSIGFLLKGFPVMVFFILTGFWICLLDPGVWRRYISKDHIISLLIPGVIVGGYYFLYQQSGDIDESLAGLADQAARRTILRYDVLAVIKHVFTYPFENLYHFLPWTLVGFVFFKKGTWTAKKDNAVVFYCMGAFIINIVPYWVSPEVYPRYVLMLIPIAFSVLVFWYQNIDADSWWQRGYDLLFNILGFGGLVFMGISFLHEKASLIAYWPAKIAACMLAAGVLVFFLIKTSSKILILVNILLVMRIAFNWFVFPIRTMEDKGLRAKVDALRIAEKYGDQDLHMYQTSIRDYTTIFHIENRIKKKITPDTRGEVFLFNPEEYENLPQGYEVVDSLYVRRIDQQAWVIRQATKKQPK